MVMLLRRLSPLLGVGLLAAGGWGLAAAESPFEGHARWFLVFGVLVLTHAALRLTYRPSGTPWPESSSDDPRPLRLGWIDYAKAFGCWIDGFRHTYAVEPGLYYLGQAHDPSTPLLVTANYHLTVFLVARHARTARWIARMTALFPPC